MTQRRRNATIGLVGLDVVALGVLVLAWIARPTFWARPSNGSSGTVPLELCVTVIVALLVLATLTVGEGARFINRTRVRAATAITLGILAVVAFYAWSALQVSHT
jgi:hypothetical protein